MLDQAYEDEYEEEEYEEDDVVEDGVDGQGTAPEVERSALASSLMSSTRGLKRSRNGAVKEVVLSDYPAIAKGMVGHAQTKVEEPDVVVLKQEEIMGRMDSSAEAAPGQREAAVEEGVAELTKLWQQHAHASETREAGLGPVDEEAFTRATYLSALLLQLHHPHTATKQHQQTRLARGAKKTDPSGRTTIPRALLDWLNASHVPFPDDFDTVWRFQPSPSAHERFWDSVYYSLIRGKFEQAIRLLSDAGWENALTDEDDDDGNTFTDRQLDNIEQVIEDCIRLLRSCPALKDGDWDVKAPSWTLFRNSARSTLRNLEIFAGEQDIDNLDESITNNGGNVFRMGESMMNFSTASRKAESKVPWSIYENLKLLYSVLLGEVDALCDTSQDWLEASIYLTVWWDGEADPAAGGEGLRASQSMRRSLGFSTSKTGGKRGTREVDVAPGAAYRKRLADSFSLVVSTGDDPVFQPDTLDPVQIGLACLLTDNVETVLSLLRSWSLTVASAVVEVAALANWLPHARPRSNQGLLDRGFSSEDLMVLSQGPSSNRGSRAGEIDRDEILSAYADVLAQEDAFKPEEGPAEKEGWELAVGVLGRMDDQQTGQGKIGDLLEQIELLNEGRVDRVLTACRELGLGGQAKGIAERYADNLATAPDASPAYGPALIYYARAHATSKLKDTLSLLTSLCLLHSASYPPVKDLDTQMQSLLSKDRIPLVVLAREDPDAASLLAKALSGYATVRRFYDLRDQDISGTSTAILRPLERKREAAKALIAVTESAADPIHGGLYDPSIESVVSVDCLLALLGEVLPLLGQPQRIFTRDQVFGLLRMVEDFASAPGRVRENAESLLQASVTAYRSGESGSAASKNLRKSTRGNDLSKSTGLGASSYDMLASSIMPGGKGAGRGEKIERAWDWRRGLDGLAGGVEVGGNEVLMLLRVALTQEVGRGWSGVVRW